LNTRIPLAPGPTPASACAPYLLGGAPSDLPVRPNTTAATLGVRGYTG